MEPSAALPAELAAVAVEGARRAGELIVRERPADLGVATKSTATDVVTVMDRASERLLRELFARRRPGDGVLGEEGADVPSSTGITWVVDPIDGTVNYLYDIPAYAVSVAACTGDVRRDGGYRVLAGAVYDPVGDELFHAAANAGAWLTTRTGRRRLTVRGGTPLAQALIGTGFGYAADKRARQGRIVADLLPRVRDIRRGGSAALDLCFVAAGRLDAYYECGTHVWDRAAAELIVAEAGGVLRGADGGAPGERLAVAGPPDLVTALMTRPLQA